MEQAILQYEFLATPLLQNEILKPTSTFIAAPVRAPVALASSLKLEKNSVIDN